MSKMAEPLSIEARSEVLARVLHTQAVNGWRITSQTPTQAQLVKGRRVNHILHLLLTLVTLGFWAIVWIIVAATGGERRLFVNVDEFGNVSPSTLQLAKPRRPLGVAERREILDRVLADSEARGRRVISRTDLIAEVETSRRPRKRYTVSVDEFGNVFWRE